MMHIYCGNGKGKTTAALGLALRAAGAGMKIYIVQLLKGSESSEIESLKLIDNIEAERLPKNFGFAFSMSENDKADVTAYHNEMLERAYERMKKHELDMLIIDEFFAAYNLNMLDRRLAEKIVSERENDCELVLTGREPEKFFIEAADYVSEISAVKHPYEKGITARRGIEF